MLQSLASRVAKLNQPNYNSSRKTNFEVLYKKIEKNLSKASYKTSDEHGDYLVIDANSFAYKLKPDLERWVDMYEKGQITLNDFEFLISGKRDKAYMNALKHVQLPKPQIEKYKDEILNSIYNSIVASLI